MDERELKHAKALTAEAKERAWMHALGTLVLVVGGTIVIGAVVGAFFGLNHYWLWSAHMTGEQELARAEGNRQIVILEAKAKKDSAYALSEAEIIRAEGLAKANKIIGDSLRQNESYLRYLWIQSLDKTGNKVIYVPTEANLPILEAQRLMVE